MTDALGRMTRTFYDALNRPVGTISNWSGSITAENQLSTCFSLDTERDSDICALVAYDSVGNTTVMTDTLGRMTHTFYDDLDRVSVQINNWDGSLTDPDNCVYDPQNMAESNLCTRFVYNDLSQLVQTTNPLSQTELTVYDGVGRPFLTVQNWDGTTSIADENDCIFPAADAEHNICRFTTYDALGRRSTVTDPLGNVTTTLYDGAGRTVTTTRTLDGTPITTVQRLYDGLGNRIGRGDARDNVDVTNYDSLNRADVSISPEGVVITTTYNALGWVLQTTNSLGYTTTMRYDLLGRQTRTADGEGYTTEIGYDALGNQTVMTDALQIGTTYLYDGLNRLIQVTENDVVGNNPTADQDVSTYYRYDALGNRVVITNARSFTASLTTYDTLNRPVTVADSAGNLAQFAYDALGNTRVMTDRNGAVTTYTYDSLNRLRQTAYLSDTTSTEFEYDVLGNHTAMTDSIGTTSYQYDSWSRLITMTHPITGQVVYKYDDSGNQTDIQYPSGESVNYQFDDDDRLTLVTDWNGDTTGYQYDGIGRLITTTLPNEVVIAHLYDKANRLRGITQTHMTGELLASYHYTLDPLGNRTQSVERHAKLCIADEISAQLSNQDILLQWAQAASNFDGHTVYRNGTPYFSASSSTAVDTISAGSGYSTTVANQPNYYYTVLPTNCQLQTSDTTAPEVAHFSFALVPGGGSGGGSIPTASNIAPIYGTPSLTTTEVTTITYLYDDLYRLTDAAYTGTVSATYRYDYDAVGNMTAVTSTVGATTTEVTRYFNGDNELINEIEATAGTTTYLYDDNGNVTLEMAPNDVTKRYSYDQRNLLVTFTHEISSVVQVTVTYRYDGQNGRISQTANGQTTTYTNDNGGLAQVLTADDGSTRKVNLFGLDLIGQQIGSGFYTLLGDGLGSVRTEMRADKVAAQATYAPYGAIVDSSGTSQSDYGFTGEQFNGSTGLVYLRARYYNVGNGVFHGRDPWSGDGQRPSTLHKYNYTLNNPINMIDPSGLCAGSTSNQGADPACWDYLLSDFCNDVECKMFGWTQWFNLDSIGYFPRPEYRFPVPWTKAQLKTLAESTQTVFNVLEKYNINWKRTNLQNIRFSLNPTGGTSNYDPSTQNVSIASNILGFPNSNDKNRVVYHELGHVLQTPYSGWSQPRRGLNNLVTGFTPYNLYDDFYDQTRCEYGEIQPLIYRLYPVTRSTNETFRAELWADAFAAFIFVENNHGRYPNSNEWRVVQENLNTDFGMTTFVRDVLISAYGGTVPD